MCVIAECFMDTNNGPRPITHTRCDHYDLGDSRATSGRHREVILQSQMLTGDPTPIEGYLNLFPQNVKLSTSGAT
jgi:hypothetical protein